MMRAIKKRFTPNDKLRRYLPSWSVSAILLLALAATMTNLNNHLYTKKYGVVIHDVMSYYSYLPAAFIYNDLSFAFVKEDPQRFEGLIHTYQTPQGGSYQKMTMGLAMLYSPFFGIGHLSAWLGGAPMDGYSQPYMFWLLFSSMFYMLLGLIILRKLLSRFFSDRIIAFVLLSIVAGTNLFYYTTLEAAMSHSYNFFLFILFIWLTWRWHEQVEWYHSVFVGLTYGLIVLIRPTNALIVVFFILFNIKKWSDVKARLRFYLEKWPQILLIAMMALLAVSPQLVFWKTYTGSWIYYSYIDEGFFFEKPQIFRGLFSYRKGWLLYTPVMLFGLIGIWFLKRKIPAIFIPILVFSLLNIYIIYSWWDFSYGGSFGSRPMIDSYGMMALSMAALFDWVSRKSKWKSYLINTAVVLLVLLNIFQTLQYKWGVIHYREMSKAAYWYQFGKLSASAEYYNLLEPLNYELLIKGVYATSPKAFNMILHPLEMDFETLTKDGKHYLSADGHYKFNHFDTQSPLQARQGSFSALLDANRRFVGSIDFHVKDRQRYRITAWKKPAQSRASLVVAATDKDAFYQQTEIIDSIDAKGWGRLQMDIVLPDTIKNQYRFYFWNKSNDTVFVDDLKIEKLPLFQ